MKGILGNFFDFASKEEKEKRRKRYFNKMYPFGEAQHQWEIDILKELYPKSRMRKDMHYGIITLRQAFVSSRLDKDSEHYVALKVGHGMWKKDRMMKDLKPEEKKVIEAIAYLEDKAESFEELPEIDAILECAKTIRIEDMYKKTKEVEDNEQIS